MSARIICLSLILLWALSSCQAGGHLVSTATESALTPTQAKLNQETKMIKTLENLCHLLSRDPLTAQEVATSLGTIVEDKGQDSSVIIRPSNSELEEAQVIREVGTNEPAHVDLVLVEPSKLKLKTLSAKFGNYTKLPKLHWNNPTKLIFYVDIPHTSHTCAIVVDVTTQENNIDDSIVTAVTVRRDIRLE